MPSPSHHPTASRGGSNLVVLTAWAMLALPLHAEAQSRRPLELEDYYRFKDAGSPALSPDGSRVAYVVTAKGACEVRPVPGVVPRWLDALAHPAPDVDPVGVVGRIPVAARDLVAPQRGQHTTDPGR